MVASIANAVDIGGALVDERPRLVRLCATLTGSTDAAEDLAQETLLEAWRLRDRVTEPAGLSAWAAAIARNVCHRWSRAQGRELAHLAPTAFEAQGDGALESTEAPPLAFAPDEGATQVERAELAALLRRALAPLPEDTRALMLASAVEEAPTDELARIFGLSEGAVRVRLHRGRQTLRRALSGDLRADAEALDLTLPEAPVWTTTRIWCPFCGAARLRYRIDRQTGEYAIVCAGRCAGYTIAGSATNQELVAAVHSPKSLLTRHCLFLAVAYRQALAGADVRCDCGAPVTFAPWTPPDTPPENSIPYGIVGVCPTCGLVDGASAWHLALDTTEAQQFWRKHPRMRALPIERIERDNRPALVSGFESVESRARLEIVSDAANYALLHVATTAAI